MRQWCEGFLLCVPGNCFPHKTMSSLQAEQDSVMVLIVLLPADRSFTGCSYKEINKKKSFIPFETSSHNPILLAAKPRHRNSRTEKGCEGLVLPGCWDSLKDSLTDPVTCKPSTQGLCRDAILQPVGKGLSRKCLEVDRLMRLRSGSQAWSTGYCSLTWPTMHTRWKSHRAQTPHGGVRNAYDHFSSFVLFHLDLNNFLKLIFCLPPGISIHAYSFLSIFMAFISGTFSFISSFSFLRCTNSYSTHFIILINSFSLSPWLFEVLVLWLVTLLGYLNFPLDLGQFFLWSKFFICLFFVFLYFYFFFFYEELLLCGCFYQSCWLLSASE